MLLGGSKGNIGKKRVMKDLAVKCANRSITRCLIRFKKPIFHSLKVGMKLEAAGLFKYVRSSIGHQTLKPGSHL